MNRVTGILAILCVAYLQYANANTKILHKSLVHLDKRLIFDPFYYNDQRLTYALCEKNLDPKQTKCTVKREKKSYDDDEYSCNVVLKPRNENGILHSDITLVPFGQDNAVLIWKEKAAKEYLTFTTVKMSSCQVGEATIDLGSSPLPFSSLHIVGYSDSFDALYKGPEISCDGKVCQVTINAEGHIVSEPRPFAGNFIKGKTRQAIVSIDEDSSKKGYFYLKSDGKEYSETLLLPNGLEKPLNTHKLPKDILAMSINNNLIGTCYEADSKHICNQYDLDGNSKLQATVPANSDKAVLFGVHNLPNGGFYLLSMETKTESPGEDIRFVVERINASGEKTGSYIIKEFDYSRKEFGLTYAVYENETKDTCVSLVAHDAEDAYATKESKGRLVLTVNCFTDADFSS